MAEDWPARSHHLDPIVDEEPEFHYADTVKAMRVSPLIEAIGEVHGAICETSLNDCLGYHGRCVKAVEAAAPVFERMFSPAQTVTAVRSDGAHSRACGMITHRRGHDVCATDCPTCGRYT